MIDRHTLTISQSAPPPAPPARVIRLLLGSAVVLPFLFVPGCKKESTPPVEVTVQAEHPEQGTIAEHISVDAILSPLAQAAIEPKITAPVRRFYVQRGAKVKEGQLLAVLENTDLTAAALDNKGSYMAAQAAYETATKAQVPEDVQKAELDLAQAKANLGLNESIVKSRKQLFAEGAIAGRDLDTAQAALVQAQAAYDTAAKHLEILLRGDKMPASSRFVRLPPLGVVQRQSTNVLAVEDANVADALRFIREHACDPCNVQDVLREVPVGRRWLERNFLSVIGRTPHHEIARVRIEAAKRLLLQPELKIPEVAGRCGFTVTQTFNRAFRLATDSTPAAYRRAAHRGATAVAGR